MRRSSLDHGNRQAWMLAGVIIALIITLAAVVAVGTKEITDTRHAATARTAITDTVHDEVQCVATWANTFSLRVEQQTSADARRLTALDVLVRALRHGTPQRWHTALQRYLTASDTYRRQLRTHPLPAAPQFLCDQLDTGVLPSTTITVSPRPATTTRTVRPRPPHVTVTATVTEPAPARTVTRAPRPTVTVTRTCRHGPHGACR